TANSCPTGGVCAQPGTTPVFGEFCDPSNCDVEVHNQGDSDDFTRGTFETYQCATCCVDWVFCFIGSSAPGDSGGGCDNVGGEGFNPVDGGAGNDGCSPIMVDVQAEGFHLTSAANGVSFDISGTGHLVRLGWTDARFHNAFLALPGPDNLVHNGKQLFGNFTLQPPSAHPNGFIALAEYDQPENGGNRDGVIDEKDQVFSRLRL